MTIFGALRVKNEMRWLERVLPSYARLCERIVVFDDHSTDGTAEFCERLEYCTVIRSGFEGIHESRDKDALLDRVMTFVSDFHLTGNPSSPYWCLLVDGDEEMYPGDEELIWTAIHSGEADAYSLKILYLWNAEDQVRVDGVYRHFARPSIFRLMNRAFRFQRTPNGGNFHCSSIPQELLHNHKPCGARLLHYGYIDAELRKRKYEFYNTVDPNDVGEDFYRHIMQGDCEEIPASARLVHAGPLEIIPISQY